MLLLRYQRQRAHEAEEGAGAHSEPDVRRKFNDRDLKGDNHRAATRSTLICIFVCGTILLILGLTLLLSGLLIPKLKKDPTPWLVVGPTCIVLGILVLLLSVEIILKLRKIASAEGSSDSKDSEASKSVWAGGPDSNGSADDALKVISDGDVISRIPVVIQPPTPLRQLDPVTLPHTVVDRR